MAWEKRDFKTTEHSLLTTKKPDDLSPSITLVGTEYEDGANFLDAAILDEDEDISLSLVRSPKGDDENAVWVSAYAGDGMFDLGVLPKDISAYIARNYGPEMSVGGRLLKGAKNETDAKFKIELAFSDDADNHFIGDKDDLWGTVREDIAEEQSKVDMEDHLFELYLQAVETFDQQGRIEIVGSDVYVLSIPTDNVPQVKALVEDTTFEAVYAADKIAQEAQSEKDNLHAIGGFIAIALIVLIIFVSMS